MKVNLYMDVYRGQKNYFYANSEAGKKTDGYTRYKIVVEIPDPLEVDAEAPVVEQIRED